MPSKKLYLQISFEQGMIDTIVADYDYQETDLKWQAPQGRSALYIENYDPTTVKGALTKRFGYSLLRIEGEENTGDKGLVNGLPIATGYSINTVQSVDLNRFTDLSDKDPSPLQALTSGQEDCLTVCGATVVPYNKPVAQNVLVYFLRYIVETNPKEEKTRIVHYGYQQNTINAEPSWVNAHTNGSSLSSERQNGSVRATVYPSVYPGWDARGTFTDAARHGGTLIFTTNVASETYPWIAGLISGTSFVWTLPWTEKMYPCYVWQYWDLRRKRNDNRLYWNIRKQDGVTTPDTLGDLVANYAVNDKYSQFKILYPSLKITRDTDFVSWKTYKTNSVLENATFAPGGDIQTLMPSLINNVPVNSIVEVAVIEARGRDFTTAGTNISISAGMVPEERLQPVKEYFLLNDYVENIATAELLNISSWPTYVDNEYWKGKNTVTLELDSIEIVEGELQYSDRRKTAKVIGATIRGSKYADTGIKVGNGKAREDFFETSESPFWIVGISLPNYLSANAPRPWFKGEEIPLCLTATIRGAEVIVGTYTHIIESDDYNANPALWYPYAPTDKLLGQNDGGFYDTRDQRESAIIGTPPNNNLQGCYIHGDVLKEAYYLVNDTLLKFNGKSVYIAPIRGFAFQDVGYYPPPGVNWQLQYGINYYLYNTFHPWCVEPFNPTSNFPYVVQPGDPFGAIPPYDTAWDDYEKQTLYHRAVAHDVAAWGLFGGNYIFESNDNFTAGYRKNHTNPKLLFVTLKIDKSKFAELLEYNIESFNLYCAQPSQESLFNSVGTSGLDDPTPGIYMLPDKPVQDDYSKYRLVKKFVVDGDGLPFYDYNTVPQKEYWKKNYNKNLPLATNSWVEFTNTIIATGQHKTNKQAGLQLTSDFILWDYPTTTTLSLNSSGKYWQGRGAKMVCNIKGRVFLGGCIDKYGEEEQALIRYSDVQSGVITLDVFSEENFLRVGGLPHVAFIEYREHLWIFSRSECHRIQMPSVTDPSSWEYLDKIPGQGTFNNKTIITTPHGVIWANEGGVWLGDGRMPTNIAQNVLTFYKAMATNNPPYYATKIDLPRFPFNEFGYNPYMEVAYDEFKNELVISSPIATLIGVTDFQPEAFQQISGEYRLVYSFDNQIWHVQHADLPLFSVYLNELDAVGGITM